MTGTGFLHAIDLGTSTSAIVVGRPDGTVRQVYDPLRADSASIPTSVCVLPDGEIAVGTKAENAKHAYPAAYRREFKQNFGDDTLSRPGGRPLTAADMTTEVIRFLRGQALAAAPGTPDRVVVTIPASWQAGNRQRMRDVVRRAGYGEAEIDLVPEPVAAVVHAFGQQPLLSDPLTVLWPGARRAGSRSWAPRTGSTASAARPSTASSSAWSGHDTEPRCRPPWTAALMTRKHCVAG
jgi:molecular chaperone DnaK (HSP70)